MRRSEARIVDLGASSDFPAPVTVSLPTPTPKLSPISLPPMDTTDSASPMSSVPSSPSVTPHAKSSSPCSPQRARLQAHLTGGDQLYQLDPPPVPGRAIPCGFYTLVRAKVEEKGEVTVLGKMPIGHPELYKRYFVEPNENPAVIKERVSAAGEAVIDNHGALYLASNSTGNFSDLYKSKDAKACAEIMRVSPSQFCTFDIWEPIRDQLFKTKTVNAQYRPEPPTTFDAIHEAIASARGLPSSPEQKAWFSSPLPVSPSPKRSSKASSRGSNSVGVSADPSVSSPAQSKRGLRRFSSRAAGSMPGSANSESASSMGSPDAASSTPTKRGSTVSLYRQLVETKKDSDSPAMSREGSVASLSELESKSMRTSQDSDSPMLSAYNSLASSPAFSREGSVNPVPELTLSKSDFDEEVKLDSPVSASLPIQLSPSNAVAVTIEPTKGGGVSVALLSILRESSQPRVSVASHSYSL